ncbi:hypothetical protein GCM10020254_24140 [Streptomyces goshikiensis]
MAVRAGGLQHQDVARPVLARQAREPGVRAVRAEAVVGVVGADLELPGGDDQPLAREVRGEPLAAPGGGGVGRDPVGGGQRRGGPVARHVAGQFGGYGQVVAARVQAGGEA